MMYLHARFRLALIWWQLSLRNLRFVLKLAASLALAVAGQNTSSQQDDITLIIIDAVEIPDGP